MEEKSTNDKIFDSIYRAHSDSIFKVARHYSKSDEIAQEITQEAFFKLYTHFDDVDLEYVEAWLVTTTKNLLFNYNRDSKHEILDEALEVILEAKEFLYCIGSAEESYMRKKQKHLAKNLRDKILENLYKEHAEWYEAIVLVYCLDKPQKKAADELGITLTVLHSRLYRAKQWIRKNYGEKYEEVVNWF